MKYGFVLIGIFFSKGLSGFVIDKLNTSKSLNQTEHLSSKQIARFFTPSHPSLLKAIVKTNINHLYNVAQDTLRFLRYYKEHKKLLNKEGLRKIIDENKTIETLEFIIKTIEEDRSSGRNFRLKNPFFLQKHFNFLSWKPDQLTASQHSVKMQDHNNIRLTYYVIFKAQASHQKTDYYSHALYQLLDNSIASRYTKQEIVSGILELPKHKNKVRPLAWVTRNSLEDALLQGTIMLNFSNGSKKIFVVDINNEIPYNKKEKNKRNQKRYWYFAPVKNEQNFIKKLEKRKKIIVAGDINSLGLGKFIILDYVNKKEKKRELQLCILADTGAAFVKNAYQLDVFAGVFSNEKLVNEYVSQQPMFAQAYIASH